MKGASTLVQSDWRRMKRSRLYAWIWIGGSVAQSGPPLIQRSGKEPGSALSTAGAPCPADRLDESGAAALGSGRSNVPDALSANAKAIRAVMVIKIVVTLMREHRRFAGCAHTHVPVTEAARLLAHFKDAEACAPFQITAAS